MQAAQILQSSTNHNGARAENRQTNFIRTNLTQIPSIGSFNLASHTFLPRVKKVPVTSTAANNGNNTSAAGVGGAGSSNNFKYTVKDLS